MPSQVTVGTKIGLISGGLASVTPVVGLVALYSLSSLNRKVEEMVFDPLPGMARISQTESALHEWNGNAWRHFATTDPAEMAAMERQMARLKSESETALKGYAGTITMDEDRKLFAQIGPAMGEYFVSMNLALELSRGLKKPEAVAQGISATRQFSVLRDVLHATSDCVQTET